MRPAARCGRTEARRVSCRQSFFRLAVYICRHGVPKAVACRLICAQGVYNSACFSTMPTVYEALQPLHVKAEASCFKLKGEDFHTRSPAVDISAVVAGITVSTRCAIFGVFDGHGGKRAADVTSKKVCTEGAPAAICWLRPLFGSHNLDVHLPWYPSQCSARARHAAQGFRLG
jgi:hypothetical protein